MRKQSLVFNQKKELEYLAKRVKILQRLAKKICTEKIDSFIGQYVG